jgi:DNA replication regulator DPB11
VVDTSTFVVQDSSADLSLRYLMFPSDSEAQLRAPYPQDLEMATKVNEWWVVTCLVNKRLISPQENRFCSYFHVGKIPGFEALSICSTGFSGPDLLHLKQTTELLGAKYEEYFSNKANVLICGSKPSVDKLLHAKQHNVAAVSLQWLWSCVDFGFVVGYDSHLWKNSSKGSDLQDGQRMNDLKEAGESQTGEPTKKARQNASIPTSKELM